MLPLFWGVGDAHAFRYALSKSEIRLPCATRCPLRHSSMSRLLNPARTSRVGWRGSCLPPCRANMPTSLTTACQSRAFAAPRTCCTGRPVRIVRHVCPRGSVLTHSARPAVRNVRSSAMPTCGAARPARGQRKTSTICFAAILMRGTRMVGWPTWTCSTLPPWSRKRRSDPA